MTDEDAPLRWRIVETEPFEAERDAAFISLMRLTGPDYAGRWLKELLSAVAGIAEFPGPRAYPLDEAAMARFGVEIRRKLYHGPSHKRRSRLTYRIIFSVRDPQIEQDDDDGIVHILRLRHSAAMNPAETEEREIP